MNKIKEMDLQSRKIYFVQEFLKLQNEEIISAFEKLLKKKMKSVPHEFKPMSLDEFYRRIDESLEDSKNGKLTEVSELMKEIEKWS